jgi:recombination protein RecR
VLHGLLSPLEGIGPDDLRIAELLRRLGSDEVREVIVATSPSVDGEATAMYVARVIKQLQLPGVRVSRIATGLPVGGELEYSDQATIARALASRATL